MRLFQAVEQIGVEGQLSASGRWLSLPGSFCEAIVVEVSDSHFLAWCDHPEERLVKLFRDPLEAISDGLQRSSNLRGASQPR
jgi:hypothetical protein